MAHFQPPPEIGHSSNYHDSFITDTSERLRILCQIPLSSVNPADNTKKVGLISDADIEEIANCLRDLGDEDACDRPRTFAVLYMMRCQDLLPIFKIAGRMDNSFPYLDRRSLPPLLRIDHEASHRFLELQSHVMSTACQMENGIDGPHVLTESGDLFFKSLGVLGQGGEAKVDKVESKITRHVYARKRIHRQKDMNKDKVVIKRFENELQILKKLDHHHLVKVFASYTDRKYVAIIMKPVADYDLKHYLKHCEQNTLLPAKRARFRTFYGCLASAIAYLHDNKIRHKDIKPSNILLKGDDIFITDFGTAVEFDGDNSITRGTVRTRTVQYQSPEVARGVRRGTASDVWSLGVTFLEMTTILRGETLHKMEEFLKRNGTKDEFVFENPSGAMQWTEHLRKKTAYPRIDNSPMQWIKDMLEQQALDRPTATELAESIKQSEAGFCGRCCRSDLSDSSSSDSDQDVTPIVQDEALETPRPVLMPQATPSANNTKIEQQTVKNQALKPDPHSFTLRPSKPPLHTQVFKALSAYVPRFRSITLSMPIPSTSMLPNPSINPSPQEAPLLHDQYQLNIPGSFTSFHMDIPNSADNLMQSSIQTEQPKPQDDVPKEAKLTGLLFGEILEDSINTPSQSPTSPDHDKNLGISDKSHVQELIDPIDVGPKPTKDETLSGDALSDINPQNHHFAKHPDSPKNISFDLMPLLLLPSRFLERSRSDEHLAIRNKTKSLLEDLSSENISESPGFGHQQRRASLHILSNENTEERHRKSIIADLMEWKHKWSYPSALPEIGSPLHASTNDRTESIPPISTIPLENSLPNTHSDESSVQIPQPTTIIDVPESYDPNIVSEWNAGLVPDHLLASTSSIAPPGRSPQPPSSSSEPHTTKNSLKSRLFNARNPTPLTGRNLEALNNPKPEPKVPKPPLFSIHNASIYRKKVFDDTASSVPTSIMSVRTKNKLTSFGLMLPLQDRTTDFLGTYTKEGKASAVKMLLKAGCNPGTKREPRKAPIFNAVRGATSRHTKCLRILIEHGVDVNVKANRTGKTPLLIATEQEAWSDYVKVIFLLIKGKANPNISDAAGDVPLLRLLGGGLKPLGDSQREALALLLCSPNIHVGVTLPGTQNKPLHLAIRRSDPLAVGMLLEKDHTIIEAKNSEALTPLLLAATFWKSGMTEDKLKILDLLLEKGANVRKSMPETKRTALHIAVSHGLIHGVERLLSHGANPKTCTSDGKSAHDLAVVRRKQHRCLECSECSAIENLLNMHSMVD